MQPKFRFLSQDVSPEYSNLSYFCRIQRLFKTPLNWMNKNIFQNLYFCVPKRKSYDFEMTQGWVNDDRIFIYIFISNTANADLKNHVMM